VIILGALFAVWGILVLALAKTMHVRWKGMLQDMRRAGVQNTIPLTGWFASPEGLRGMRIAGAVVLAVGVALMVAGSLRGGGMGG
jgi:hypothetical protein